jgi:pyrrolidone-carboxylate peptidase
MSSKLAELHELYGKHDRKPFASIMADGMHATLSTCSCGKIFCTNIMYNACYAQAKGYREMTSQFTNKMWAKAVMTAIQSNAVAYKIWQQLPEHGQW